MATSASLEIHVLDVGQGDSVLVINRDLAKVQAAIQSEKGAASVPAEPVDYVPYAVANNVPLAGTVKQALLMDGGDDEYGGNVVDYMQVHGVVEDPGVFPQTGEYCPNLSIAVSHYHDDHMAGLRSVFKQRIDPDPAVKGAKARFAARYRPATVYQSLPESKTNPPSQRFKDFRADVEEAFTAPADPTAVVYLHPGGLDSKGNTVTIDLGTGVGGIPIVGYFLASGQGVFDAATNAVVPIASTGSVVDQNDRSLVLMLQYGSFRCLLGGDIAGNGGPAGGNLGDNAAQAGKAFFSQHADVETELGPALEAFFPATGTWVAGQPKYPTDGYATVLKANHHGSSSSVDVHLLATVQPLVFVGSSGVKARFHAHPTQAVMNRIDVAMTPQWGRRGPAGYTVPNSIAGTYLTEVAEKVKNKSFDVDIYEAEIMGDVVIRPYDETISAVQSANAKGPGMTVQVYGTGVMTDLVDPATTLRPVTGPYQPTAIYPLGPIEHVEQF